MEITKDQVVEITKENPSLKKVVVGLGWDVNTDGGQAYDLDANALVLENGRLRANADAVFFKNKTAPGVAHSGDNLTGEGEGDDEQIKINLDDVTGNQVDVIVTLYQAKQRKQDFSKIQNAFIRIFNEEDNKELAKFTVTGADVKGGALLFASLLKVDGNWQFKAIGTELTGEITEVLSSYGYDTAKAA